MEGQQEMHSEHNEELRNCLLWESVYRSYLCIFKYLKGLLLIRICHHFKTYSLYDLRKGLWPSMT